MLLSTRLLGALLFAVALFVFRVDVVAQELVINEFLTANGGGLEDADRDTPDWIELHAPGPVGVDTDGWALTDDPAIPFKWVFPSRLVGAGEYLIVFASGKNRTGDELHANFALDSRGDFLALVRPDGRFAQLFAPAYPPQRENISYGLGGTTARTETLGDTVSWLVPADGGDGLDWTSPGFDDARWNAGARMPIGYERIDQGAEVTNFYSGLVAAADGLVGYWRLGESDGLAVMDELGRHHGSFSGAVMLGAPGVIVGDADTSVDFEGGAVDVPADAALDVGAGALTVEAWVQPAAGGAFQWIISKGIGTSSVDYLLGLTSSNTVRFISQGLANVATSSAPLLIDGQRWYHIVAVQDPGAREIRLHVDGEVAFRGELREGGAIPAGHGVRIGARTFGSVQPFDGRIDEVAIYRRALPVTEIREHFETALEPGGFRRILETDVEAAMHGVNATIYVRSPFDVETPDELTSLSMGVRYDAGFVAYLNGREVARRNAPPVTDWRSGATAARPGDDLLTSELIDLSAHVDALRPGLNVLALHGLNDGATSPTFLLDVTLVGTRSETLVFFPEPTPGRANGRGVAGFVTAVEFSRPRGFYDAPLDVELATATPGAVIRYTLDGSWPAPGRGDVYDGPIRITGTTLLRAAGFRDGWAPSLVGTHTYVFVDEVIRQTGAGFPSTWNGVRADYAMDPTIVDDPRYGATIRDDLKAIPTLSVVADVQDLFGSGGVYSNPTQRGSAWERPCSVELFETSGEREFQVNAGLRAHGGSSRRPDITPQHSLRLHFRSEYGAAKLRFPVFGDGAPESYDTLVISANSSDNWTSANTATGVVGQFIRDQWARDVHAAMGHLAIRGFYTHLYLNGLYWGLYNLVERVDDEFAAGNLGGAAEDYDVIIDRSAFRGNLSAWSSLLQRARARDWDGVNELMHVDNFIDYMIVEMFTGNWDWPDHNWHALRRRAPGEKFHFVVWDAEVGLGLSPNIPGPIRPNVLTVDLTGPRADVSTSALANGPGEIYNALGPHPEFRVAFGDRLQRHLFNDGVLTTQRARELYRRRADEIEAALVGESARWGDVRRRPPDVPDGRWRTERDWILDVFFDRRPAIVLDQFRRRGLYPAIDAPVFNRHGGRVPEGFPIVPSARAEEILLTVDGADPRLPGGDVARSAFSVDPGGRSALVPSGAPVRVLVPVDGALGLDWIALDFDDSGWREGVTGVGFEATTGFEELIGTDVQGEAYQKSSTVYARIEFEVASPEELGALELRMKYDDGFIAYLNGQRVASMNAPDDPAWDSRATGSNPDSSAIVFESFDLADSISLLREGTNVLAIHALNVTSASSDMLALPELVASRGGEGGLVLDAPALVRARARDGGRWSALVEAFFFFDIPLRITELMYHPRDPEPGSRFADDDFEFIELQNVGSETIELDGFRLAGGIDFAFPARALAPGEVLVVVRDLSAFASRYGDRGIRVEGRYRGRLDNSTDLVRLEGPAGEPLLEVEYSDAWQPRTDGQGSSLVIADPDGDPESWREAASWLASDELDGTPGTVGRPAGQLPGDVNQDGDIDISDAVAILVHLFVRPIADPPCGGSIDDEPSRTVFDISGNGTIDLADPVRILEYLFRRGPAPALGTGCVRIEGCPDVCRG